MITLALCTWNRARLVERTLSSFTRLEIPATIQWEVVVVNNNSTDSTAAVVESFASKLPLRHFVETKQGVAHARNRAAQEAQGEFVLWTDDDVEVKPDWMMKYLKALAAHPECGFFGGPVELRFEGAAPQWLLSGQESIGEAYGQLRVPAAVPIREGGALPFNCNMAVRRQHHLDHPYDTRYGRKAGSLMSGEETVFLQELLREGIRGEWLPDTAVLHNIPAERQTVAHLRKLLSGVGRELALRSPDHSRLAFLGVPLWLWRQALSHEARFRWGKLKHASSGWQDDLATASISWGRIQYTLENRSTR